MTLTASRPKVLFIHNGDPYDAHIKHLTDAGLRVTETHEGSAIAEALKVQPDIIVLDFGSDGDVTAQLKAHSLTRNIPIIALAELTRRT